MNDCVRYKGRIRVSDALDKERIKALFSKAFDHAMVNAYGDNDYNHTYEISFSHKGHYAEESVFEALKTIQPYTLFGEITYSNDAGEYWRQEFDDPSGLWVNQHGRIEYDEIGESISALLSERYAEEEITAADDSWER